ncbi:hypothetical protein HZR00_07805 [Elizabethkingia anophelis]|nr:hypothetical protein [Elizabethkingia anophelis]
MSSCRTEDGAITQKQIEDKRFNVFVSTSPNEKVDYANGFAYLMKRADELHKSNMSGINNKSIIGTLASAGKNTSAFQDTEPYVEFKIRSEMTTEKNGDKWLVFPKVQGNKVIALVLAYLSKQETKVNYYTYGEQNAWFKENVLVYQNALNKLQKRNVLSLNASIKPMADNGVPCPPNTVPDPTGGCMRLSDIDGVIITVKGPANSGLTSIDGGSSYDSGGSYGYGCEYYNSCYPTPPVPPNPPQEDPCSKAKAPAEKATNDYKDPAVQAAKKAVQDGYNSDPADKKSEYTTMINEEAGKLNKGTTYGGYNSSNVQGGVISTTVADIHNHNDEFPPSPGDVYGVMQAFNYFQKFRTRYVYTQGGEEYAIVVTDPAALQNFYQTFPPNVTQGETRIYTNFSGQAYEDWLSIVQQYGNNMNGQEIALAQVLNKYNAGVAITKKDKTTGDFKKLNVAENSNGQKTITNCN